MNPSPKPRAPGDNAAPPRFNPRDVPNLDVVRSMAVVSVVVEHYLLAYQVDRVGPYETAWFGVLGVMIFFVLTCVVLMWSLERKPHTLDFYIRRWFRIYPLALVALTAAAVCHLPVAAGGFNHAGLRHLLAEGTLLPGVVENTLGPMWSLPYEVGMYILLPVLFFFVRRNFSLWPLLLLWAITIFVTHEVPSNGHNFGVAIAYFLPGVMAYVCFAKWKPVLPGILLPVFVAAAWLLFWYRADFHQMWFFCLVVGLGLPLFQQIRSALILAPSRVIARYSYSIYLTHPFAIAIGTYLLRGRPVWEQLAVSALPLAIVPFVTYHLIEHPLIGYGSRVANRAETLYEQKEYETLLPLPGN